MIRLSGRPGAAQGDCRLANFTTDDLAALTVPGILLSSPAPEGHGTM